MSVYCSGSIFEGPNYCENTVTVDLNLSFITGDWIKFTCIDNPCLSLIAQVTTYNPSTGEIAYTTS